LTELGGEYYCDGCYEDRALCEGCREVFYKSDLDDNNLCEDCKEVEDENI